MPARFLFLWQRCFLVSYQILRLKRNFLWTHTSKFSLSSVFFGFLFWRWGLILLYLDLSFFFDANNCKPKHQKFWLWECIRGTFSSLIFLELQEKNCSSNTISCKSNFNMNVSWLWAWRTLAQRRSNFCTHANEKFS